MGRLHWDVEEGVFASIWRTDIDDTGWEAVSVAAVSAVSVVLKALMEP